MAITKHGFRREWLFGGLLLLALALPKLAHFKHHPTPINPDEPDAVSHQITVIKTDATGKLSHQFTATAAKHYPAPDRTYFTAPHIVVYQTHQSPWHLTANNAISDDDFTHVVLTQQVVLQRASSQANPATTIKTDKLHVYPKKRRVTTQSHVQAVEAGNHAQSDGLELDLKRNTLALLSHVEATYLPAS